MAIEVRTLTAGNVWKVLVQPGDIVAEGDTLFIMEVMKMEVPHTAPVGGKVTAVYVASDQEGLDADAPAVDLEEGA
jgi:acetyl-CoA carboxylase biotin carboxyl carrier protein